MPDAPFSSTLLERLASARRVAVLTGAGISAESGIPTFRDPDGLWQRFRPEELASVEAFLANPVLVQGWYRHRRDVAERARPNAGHEALAALERLVEALPGGHFLLATQNVDGLHRRAGTRRLAELHGSILDARCLACAAPAPEQLLAAAGDGAPVRCARCGGLLRPGVVWFGEMLPEDTFAEAQEAAALCDVFLSVGTSGAVYPAAGLPLLARQAGAYVAEINPVRSDIAHHLHETVLGRAGEVLPALVAALEARRAAA
ncbi:MAG: SIR2 family NAD-dependent protein deacylase [Rubricoccaceae bacterium]